MVVVGRLLPASQSARISIAIPSTTFPSLETVQRPAEGREGPPEAVSGVFNLRLSEVILHTGKPPAEAARLGRSLMRNRTGVVGGSSGGSVRSAVSFRLDAPRAVRRRARHQQRPVRS
jgi:hypothetical protein